MKFKLLLWVLGFMMKRASRNNPSFQKTLAGQNLTFQLSSKDGAARHYIVKEQQIYPISGTTAEPTFELCFSSAAKGFEILTAKKAQEAFIRGVQEQHIVATGDLSKMKWFQTMISAMKK